MFLVLALQGEKLIALFSFYLCLSACLSWTTLWAVLVATLRSHGQANAALANIGLRAIANLSIDHPANRTRLGEADACAGQRTRHTMCASVGVAACSCIWNISGYVSSGMADVFISSLRCMVCELRDCDVKVVVCLLSKC